MKKNSYDVVIIGAGAAGIGVGALLQLLEINNFVVLERQEIGASFGMWPQEMKFISPSFPGHGFGALDLNAIVPNTSPGHVLKSEHPSGKEYQIYLRSVAKHFELPVETGIDVLSLQRHSSKRKGFTLETNQGTISSRTVIWAAGEFQYPNLNSIPGAEHCIHNSTVKSWKEYKGKDYIVIGGFESGIDAAVNLALNGNKVRVFDKEEAWNSESSDPSCSISTYTYERLRWVMDKGLITLHGNSTIKKIEKSGDGFIITNGKEKIRTKNPPVLATGFKTSLSLIRDQFEWEEKENYPLLTESDESTITPGLFLVGPNVRHDDLIFCFIYKFRQRFGVVAQEIAKRIGHKDIDTSVFDFYRDKGMLLDDLSCCGDECAC
ncbi:MAG: NAD(P)/FAD-dependent oxidoreductase [Thermodesulfobacteriota bacterium]